MRWLSVILVGLLVTSALLPMGQADPAEAVPVLVWTADAAAVEATGAEVFQEYGAFLLALATAEQQAALMRDFRVESVEREISKGAVRFDPSDGDLPVVLGMAADADAPYRIVQFIGPIHRDWLGWLAERAEILDYVPHHAFIVRGDDLDALSDFEAVAYVGEVHPTYKLHPWIPAEGTWEFDIQVWRGGDVASVMERVVALGGEVLLTATNGAEPYLRIRLDAAATSELARAADVGWVETVFPTDPVDNAQAAWVTQSGVSPAASGVTTLLDPGPVGRSVHEAGITGAGQILAVADGGIDSAGGAFLHEMFDDPAYGPYQFGQMNPGHRKMHAYYALIEDGVLRTDYVGHYHGVHVSGSVAGDAPESGAYATYNANDGQSFAGRIVKVDVARGGSFQLPVDYHNAFAPTYAAGARLHSNSYGYSHDNSYTIRARQNDLFTEDHPDFLIFRSMGNTGGNTIRPEAVAKNVVGSGATLNGAQFQDMASFSSRGPTQDGRVKPTFVAPGSGVMSAGLNGNYASLSGTSMSTPTSAGAAGLVREYFEEGWYPTGQSDPGAGFNPSSALVRGTLINSAVPIGGAGTTRPGLGGAPSGLPAQFKANWPNGDMGWGIVRLDNALYFDGDDHGLFVRDGDSVATGTTVQYTIDVTDPTAGLKVTLAWVDAAASIGANPSLVNDLDLTVRLPDGSEVPGNVFAVLTGWLPGDADDPARGILEPVSFPGPADRRNVEEQVVFPTASPGPYVITVTGVNVPTGSQAFAMVVTGGI